METPNYKTALIVGAGEGLSASLARLFAREGIRVALAARRIEKLGALCSRDRRTRLCLRRHRARRGRAPVRPGRARDRAPDLVVYNASGRARGPFVDLVPAEVAQGDRGQRLRRLSGGAAGGAAHAAATARRDPVHRRLRQRQGLSAIGAVRDGQVRAARPGAEHGARIVAAGHSRRAFRHRRRHSQRGAAPSPPTSPDSMLDPDAIAPATGTCCNSRAAPGPGKWNCGHGWRSSSRVIPGRANGSAQFMP